MSYFLLAANLLTALAFLVHTFVGDREIRQLEPEKSDSDHQKRLYWTMARCGWHWISVDLLSSSVLIALINFTEILGNAEVLLFLLGLHYLAYAIVWAFVITLSKAFPSNYLKLGQWMLLLAIGGLIFAGS
ncbi:MAG: hypothetical protein ACFB10_00255 [Salibacteraceae bacterium]